MTDMKPMQREEGNKIIKMKNTTMKVHTKGKPKEDKQDHKKKILLCMTYESVIDYLLQFYC